jgi:uncharacterized protein YhbP (UPF0306 family)
MSETVQFISVTPEQLQNAIIEGVKTQLQDLKEHFEPKTPNEYLERAEVARMLNVNISTIHNWTVKGILTSFGIGRRVYYKRTEVEKAIVKLNK